MDINMLIKLITIVLAVSIASERLVTFLKTLIPKLGSNSADPAAPLPAKLEGIEKWRQISVMLIAFLAAWLTSSFLKDGHFDPWGTYDIGPPKTEISVWIIGLLASGGSAFWTNLLGYVRAIKDISTQKSLQLKMTTNHQAQAQHALKSTN